MTTIDLSSWADFKGYVASIVSDTEQKRQSGVGHFSCPLYRGQSNHEWKLETTLERAGHRNMSVDAYYRNVRSAHRYISNFGANHSALELGEFITWESLSTRLPCYEFLAYLRHHGFLSPLMDWSQSPYVAAFFAFANPESASQRAAIFVYQEHYGQGKSGASTTSTIRTQGPWASIHERHVLQQSWYTFAAKLNQQVVGEKFTESLIFSPHEEAFTASESNPIGRQDILVKFTVPRSERLTVLKDLLQMNITPYSLSHSVDALVATVGMRLFDKLAD